MAAERRPADAVVVGGGVGGLAAAIRLAAAGHRVVLCERHAELGGKLGVVRRDGFTFDVGPSLLTMPEVFAELFATAGTSLSDRLDLVPLDPQFRYRFADGSVLEVPADPARADAAVEAFSPGSGRQWAAFRDRSQRLAALAERTFLAGPMQSPLALLRRLRDPSDLVAIDGVRTLAQAARRDFTDPRLRQWLGRYATYTGSSPYRAPATLACIPGLEAARGAWYPRGGLGALRDALVDVAAGLGVELRTGTDVAAVEHDDGRVRGVRTAAGEGLAAGVEVADVDARHLYRDLLPHRRRGRAAARAPRSLSGFSLLIGVDGTTDGLAHHTVAFSPDDRREFDQLAAGTGPVDDPTVYVCCSARTDASQAPAGAENWFVLVNAPATDGIDWEAHRGPYRDHVLDVLADRGLDVRGRARFVEVTTPADLARRHRAPGGAIYGSSSDGRRAAFARPGNRGPVRGLYLVGGSAHPGGGLPLVALGAAMVDDLVARDGFR